MRYRHATLVALFLAATPLAAAIAQDKAITQDKAPGENCLRATPGDRTPGDDDCNANKAPGPGSSLSKTLSGSDGVITPPPTGDPSVKLPPPQGNTPIIPPPGTPGGNQDVQPK